MSETKFLDNLASCFEKLPGVGKKTAQRYAYYIIEKMSLDDVKELSNELVKAKENVKHCKICGMQGYNSATCPHRDKNDLDIP